MNFHSALRSFAAVLAISALPLLAQDPGAASQEKRTPPPVGVQMERLDAAMEVIAKYAQTFEGELPVAELDKALKALQESKQHAPRTAQSQPEDQRAEFLKAYRVAINNSIRAMLDLEEAILNQDKDAAMAALKAVSAAKKAGHEIYKGRRRR